MTPPHYNEAFDEYARALLAQNNGMPCTHCGSSLAIAAHVHCLTAMRQSWPVHSRLPSVP